MWCANCEEDVATEISADGQALKCITCGEVVRQVFAPSLHPETKSARDLLQKWAEEQKQQAKLIAEQSSTHESETDTAKQPVVESPVQQPALSKSNDKAETGVQQGESTAESSVKNDSDFSQKLKPKFRVDSAHVLNENETPKVPQDQKRHSLEIQSEVVPPLPEKAINKTDNPEQAQSSLNKSPRQYTSHVAHDHAPAPHFDVVAASKKAKSRPGRSEAIWGQLLAYAGVGVLTVGTVLVLWGYFGMIEQYASTGWLLSTAGQMLLLLGIVTLVSGGMQQTTHEVAERIEYLGGRMIRIEQSTEQLLNGPHFTQQKNRSSTTSLEEKDANAT